MHVRPLLAALAFAVALPAAQARAATTVIDFDGLPLGDFGGAIGDVSFSYSPADPLATIFPLVVSTGFATTSGSNYLGVQDGGPELFQPGDSVTLGFAGTVYQISVTFENAAGTQDGAFMLSAGGANALSSSANRIVLDNGDEAFVLSLSSLLPFSSAVLSGVSDFAQPFSVDDIVLTDTPVPVPAAVWLLGTGCVALLRLRRA